MVSKMALHDEIKKLEAELYKKQQELKCQQKYCQHCWLRTEYVPEIREGYVDPGDPPGTMGIDWRGPTYVSGSSTDYWTRTCGKCGLKQQTGRIKKVQSAGQIPGTTSYTEEPDFG